MTIQPWGTPFPIWNQSVVPCPVLTVASWPANRFLKRQVRWSGIPISLRIFQFIVIHTVKGFGIVNKAEIDVALAVTNCVEAQLWGATPRPRSGAAAERSYLMPEVRGSGQEEQPHDKGAAAMRAQEDQEELFHVQGQEGRPWGDTLVQGKEQRLHFAGAAVKRYPTSKVRNPSKMVDVARGHQRADTLKP